MEVEFKFNFNRNLNEKEIDEISDSFIEHIESNKTLWGGGCGSNYMQGALSYMEEGGSNNSIEDLQRIINDFYLLNKAIIQQVESREYEE